MWGRHLRHSSEQKPRTTEHRDKDSFRSSDKDRDRNHDRERDRSNKGDIRHGSEWPMSALHDTKTTMVSAAVLTSTNVHADMRVLLITTKQSRGVGSVPVHHVAAGGCTPPNVDLCHLHPPLAAPLKLSSDPAPARLSFNRSQCSLPPLELGEEDAHSLPSMGVPIQAGAPSMAGPIPLHSTSVSALNLMADHTKIIFNLACEGWHLKERVTREFVRLSSEEVLFCTQAQSSSHKMLAIRHPDWFSTYYQRNPLMPETRPWRKLLAQWVRHGHEQMRLDLTWLREEVECVPRQSWGLDPGTGGTHMDHDFPNSRRHWSTTMCLPRCSTLPSWYTAFISTKSFLPKSITYHLWVCARGLCTTLVGASQPESSSRSIFWQPQKVLRCGHEFSNVKANYQSVLT